MFFGGSRKRRYSNRGSDLRYDIEITLKEAAKGVKNQFHFLKKINANHVMALEAVILKLKNVVNVMGKDQ